MSDHRKPDDGASAGNADFASTHWSVVLAAGHRSSPDAHEALAKLCGDYWFPLYAYARRRVRDVHEAQDLTQAFFAELLAKDFLAAARPGRGRFRAFLLTAFQHCLANEWDKARAQNDGSEEREAPAGTHDEQARATGESQTGMQANQKAPGQADRHGQAQLHQCGAEDEVK